MSDIAGTLSKSNRGDILIEFDGIERYWVPADQVPYIENKIAAKILSKRGYAGRFYINRKGTAVIVEMQDGSYQTARSFFERLMIGRYTVIPLYKLPPRNDMVPAWATEGLIEGFP